MPEPMPRRISTWVDAMLPGPLPDESKATCGTCVMCKTSAPDRPVAVATFNPASKCCTYLPMLRNFQAGAILADPDPALAFGQRTLRERIHATTAITPLNVGWPSSYDKRYDVIIDDGFGEALDMRCPHYIDEQSGLCGIWQHRNAECSTWFCRHTKGERSRQMWSALNEALAALETGLSYHCAQNLDLGEAALQLAHDPYSPESTLDGAIPLTDEMVRAVWGNWHGRVEAYYLAAHEIVKGMSVSQILEVGGAMFLSKREDLHDAYDDLARTGLPPWVMRGKVDVVTADAQGVWVTGYRAYDAFAVDQAVLDALREIDIAPTGGLAEELTERVGKPITSETLQFWLDQGLLISSMP